MTYRIIRLKSTDPEHGDEVFLLLGDTRKTKPSEFYADEIAKIGGLHE